MSPLRRLAAVFSGALLLQLTLLSSGTLCGMRADHANTGAFAASVSAVAHGAMPDDCGGTKSHDCGSPHAPGQCVTMSGCVTVAAARASAVVSVASAIGTMPVAAPAGMHSGPAAAPELPPPRA